MSYLALYRKYRPYTFDTVVGQEHIIRTLTNQIQSNHIAHAYLFTGTRGTGKTSVAKIFARAVNCSTPIRGSACGECENCIRLRDSSNMNIIEIDAASHNGVDNIREINEEVKYTPAVGKYKVYIIDEVHMLSIGAFNALLKTLEEPPSHVIFILATTDPQKIPITILSRCQRFDFKRISLRQIKDTLRGYMDKEQIDIEDKALEYIARLADGAMRDALSILEQSLSFYFDETITLDKVLYLIGAVDKTLLFEMIDAIKDKDSHKLLLLSDKINTEGKSVRQLTSDLLEHCRNLLVAKTTQGGEDVLDYSKEYIEALKKQAEGVSVNELMRYIKTFSKLEYDLKMAISSRVLLEVELLKLCEPQMDESKEGILTQLEQMQNAIKNLMEKGVPQTQMMPVEPIQPIKKVVPTHLPKAVPEEVSALSHKWNEIVDSEAIEMANKVYLKNCKFGYIEGDILYIIYGDHGIKVGVNKYIDQTKAAINQFAGREVDVRLISSEDYANKSVETYGTHPKISKEVKDISNVLTEVRSKINFHIDVK